MSKELVIAASRHETKVAILEDDQLVEVYFQRSNEYSLAGSIHKGRVTRVLPGMQSAFVDLGLERDTFLYVSDFFEENEDYDRIGGKDEREARPERDNRGDRENRGEREPRGGGDREPRGEQDARSGESETRGGEREGRGNREGARGGREGRGGRGDRDRRGDRGRYNAPPRTEAPNFAAQTAAPEIEPLRVADVPEAPVLEREDAEISAPAEARGIGQVSRSEEAEERDRRGRRSRRRRSRGRGFPESKYAGADVSRERRPETASEQASSAAAMSSETVPEESGADFMVLPGESLAKYTRSSFEPLNDDEEEEIRAAAEHNTENFPVDEPEEEEPAASEHFGVATGSSGAGAALAHEPLPEAHTHISFAHHAEIPEAIPEPEYSERALSVVPEPEPEPEPESESELEPEVSMLEDPSDEIEAESYIDEDPAEIAQEMAEAGLDAPSDAHAAPEQEAEQRSANLREQGGRYMHRMPRRMRRKMRGGQPGEERGPGEGLPLQQGETTVVSGRAEMGRAALPQMSERQPSPTPLITDLLKEGQEIIVQIAKEPLGQKGARITSHIALPGRYVVYMPTLDHLGVSRKVSSDEERQRLKRILQTHKAGIPGGFILRTAGEGQSEDDIAADIRFLFNLWTDIRQKAEKQPAPALLHHDLDIVQRILRDQVTESFKSIWVDNEELYERTLRFVQRFQPALVTRVKLYTRATPIFDAFNVTAELEKALRPKVWLKSGGYIVINQTEALVAIDVNTGKYVGKSNRLEDTIVKTNTEAVKEIVRQIRLRDLGGIIVVDFIDMDERKNRQKVMQALEDAMRSDRAPNKILQFNDFGLVAITRKRVKQSLERALCAPCPYCEGAGSVKSVPTVIGEILQEAHKLVAGVADQKDVMLRVHPEVAKVLKSHQNKYLEELEEIFRKPILVKSDPALHQEKYDLA